MQVSPEQFDVRDHLNAYWLRPESAFWDAIAAKHISGQLTGKKDILEIGIGNGFFSFLMMGGEFDPEFDWFFSVNTDGFWENADIFDCDKQVSVSDFIKVRPRERIKVGVDHKQSLLNQASRLGFVDKLVNHDCNQPLEVEEPINTIYSNILYWLRDPIEVLHQSGRLLPSGGEFVAVFPNSDFYKQCQSYQNTSTLFQLLNRGRANHIMWHMDIEDFERQLKSRGVFELKYAARYLSPMTMKIWDVGLRPLSIPLIKMANSLDRKKRLEIKQEWCDTLMRFATPLLEIEMEEAARLGGFNIVTLSKR